MSRLGLFIGGVGIGALFSYWFDPRSGPRRRAVTTDRVTHLGRRAKGLLADAKHDAENRIHGKISELGHRMHREDVTDEVLEQRVRAQLGHATRHASAISVAACEGAIELRGLVAASERARVLAAARKVPGVRSLTSALEVIESPERVPAHQETAAPRSRARQDWVPVTRLAAIAAGAVLTAVAIRKVKSIPLAAFGLVLAARGAINMPLSRMTGIGAGDRAVDVEKTIEIAAPIAVVFDVFREPTRFPQFMAHVLDVRQIGPETHRWTVHGPLHRAWHFDTVVTRWDENARISWRTIPNKIVHHTGTVRFEPVDGGGTRVSVRLSYNPPAGAIGHAFAAVTGTDPHRLFDDDLLRLKSLIEQGKATGAHGSVHRDEVMRSRSFS